MSNRRFEQYRRIAQRFSARTVRFQEAAARRLELSATQLECFQLVRHDGPMTASDLARETGLTSAALSPVVDRLVALEFLIRDQDQSDRRRWILQVHPTAIPRVDAALRFVERLAETLELTTQELTESRPARAGA